MTSSPQILIHSTLTLYFFSNIYWKPSQLTSEAMALEKEPPPPQSLSLLPAPSLSTPSSLSNRKRPGREMQFPSASPTPLPPQVFFFLAPYSRQIKCTQLLPAETGLNCTPVAMAIPDDLRGWNVALQISALRPQAARTSSLGGDPQGTTSPPPLIATGGFPNDSPAVPWGQEGEVTVPVGPPFTEPFFGALQGPE